MPTPSYLRISSQVQQALDSGWPVVALESTVISHGLPYPLNGETALRCEEAIRAEGAIPATIGVINGSVTVGLSSGEIELLARGGETLRKISRRDYGIAIARRESGGTTVAGTLIAAHLAGIPLFATGGIGGVHRGDAMDISADLPELAKTPVAVVCAGAKAILDLPRTLEYLETAGVPVIGFKTDRFPAFYATDSGLPVDARAETPEEVAAILTARWEMEDTGGALIAVAPPSHLALNDEEMNRAITRALADAEARKVRGKALTPFLLGRVAEFTDGRSKTVNVALLEQNARVAARVARALRLHR